MKGIVPALTPIAVCGFKGSGKNTVCSLLDKILRRKWYETQTVAFANPIKAVVCDAFNLISDEEYDLFKRSEFSILNRTVEGRHLLRSFGMLMRHYDDMQFIKYVEQRIRMYPNKITLISDLRFTNEIDWCIMNKIPIIKVISDDTEADGHVSEVGIPDKYCTFIIENNGTLRELEEKVSKVVETIIEERRNEKE